MADEKPPEKPTHRDMTAVPMWAITLTEEVRGLRTAFSDMSQEMSRQGLVLTGLVEWKGGVEEWKKSNSLRAASASQVDEQIAAELAKAKSDAAEKQRRIEDLESKAATKEDVAALKDAMTGAAKSDEANAFRQLLVDTSREALKSGMAKKVAMSFGGLLVALCALGTALVYMRVAQLQQQPTPPPTVVVVPMSLDGGAR